MRAWLAWGLVAALCGPAACSVKKVRFTSALDGGRGGAGGMDAGPTGDAASGDAAARDAMSHDAPAADAMRADATPAPDAAVDAALHDAGGRDAAVAGAGGGADAGAGGRAGADAGPGGRAGADAGGSDARDAASADGPSTCSTDLVPVMTGPTTPSGSVLSSGTLTSDYDAWQAFDGSTTSMWISPQAQEPTSIGYAWDDGPRAVLAYAITYANGTILTRAPSAWAFQGLLNDAWITLDSRTGETGWKGFERRVYTVATPGLYSEYRLSITDDNDSSTGIVVVSIGDLEFLGCPP